jgi:hypothetical protein
LKVPLMLLAVRIVYFCPGTIWPPGAILTLAPPSVVVPLTLALLAAAPLMLIR